jgi:hypothetical protein
MDADAIDELFHERAAIREYEGGHRKERAEYLAAVDVRRTIKPQPLPGWIMDLVKPTGNER